jgi:hypothetical protein
MRLNEYQLDRAIQFHDKLNPVLWKHDAMDPTVRKALLRIAENFQKFIGVDNFDIHDVTVSGSNAAYTYTPNSDIDLHLVVMIPNEHDAELRQLFDAKKYQYNDQHDFKIYGYDVELYAQDATQPHHSMGIYSVLNDRWISHPKPQRANIDDASVKSKYDCYKHRIQHALTLDDHDHVKRIWDNIKSMRKAGLARGGEFSPENLVFKLLRAEGDMAHLKDHLTDLVDREFSLGRGI